MSDAKFVRPGAATRAANVVVLALHKLGFSAVGSRTLTVVGRRSGLPRSTPVNPLVLDGAVHLVAPRGTTEWVRNLRVAGRGTLARGRATTAFQSEEVPVEQRLPMLRAYLERWAWEVGVFFDLPKHPTDQQIAAVAHLHPVFRIRRERPLSGPAPGPAGRRR